MASNNRFNLTPSAQVKQMLDGRFYRLTATLIRRICAKFLAQIKQEDRMIGVETCFWEADMFKIGETLRHTTSCGEHYIIKNIMPFHICPFCNKTIWFTEGAKNTKQANQPDSGE